MKNQNKERIKINPYKLIYYTAYLFGMVTIMLGYYVRSLLVLETAGFLTIIIVLLILNETIEERWDLKK